MMRAYLIGLSALVCALSASARGLPPETAGARTKAVAKEIVENDCGECYDGWSTQMCDLVGALDPCHDWVYNGELPWGGGSCHEHIEYQSMGLYFADGDCWAHQWCGNPNCHTEEQENLNSELGYLSAADRMDEVREIVEFFSGRAEVWLELNFERAAVQVLRHGCRQAPGDYVIKHIPLASDMVEIWAAAFSDQ